MPSVKDNRFSRQTPEGFVCVGQFSESHGVKGSIRLKTFTGVPAAVKKFKTFYIGPDLKAADLKAEASWKAGLVVKVSGVDTPEAAKALKGFMVYVPRDDLAPLTKPGEYYHADLVGLSVVTGKGEALGRVSGLHDFGAGEIVEIILDKPRKGVGKNLMLPFRESVVGDIDLKQGIMVVDPTGWLEEEQEETQ